MRIKTARASSFALLAALLALTAGCSTLLRIHPPGEKIGSFEGRMTLRLSGRQVPFRFDLYSQDKDLRLYFTVPGQYRYRPVEDIDMEGGGIVVELSSPRAMVEGELSGKSLKFSGKFRDFSGTLNIDIDN